MSLHVVRGLPDTSQQRAIREFAGLLERADGAPPLSDQALARLGSPGVDHWLATDGGAVVGYAQVADGDGELASEDAAVAELLRAAAPALIWSHGGRSRLIGPLEQAGYSRVRELFQLRRPLEDLPADPPLPVDVTVRAFRPGHDDAAWLRLNAAAFAHHPEQGRLTQADLDARIAETWFDPAGFLLAERAGDLLAFHWTKIHDAGAAAGLGEVYVLGVAPGTQGLGLGRALLTRGLRLLAGRGCRTVLLYVDGDNPSAMHLYESAGFERYDLDAQWKCPDQSG